MGMDTRISGISRKFFPSILASFYWFFLLVFAILAVGGNNRDWGLWGSINVARKNTEQESGPHPSMDQTDRFAVDALLRRYGFIILKRGNGEEPLWMKNSEEYRQRDALRMLPYIELEEAKRSDRTS